MSDLLTAKKHLNKLAKTMRRSARRGDLFVIHYVSKALQDVSKEISDSLGFNVDFEKIDRQVEESINSQNAKKGEDLKRT